MLSVGAGTHAGRVAVTGRIGSKELLAAKVLEIRVLHPALTQRLVGQIVAVLEDGEPRHQPRRQRRVPWLVAIGRSELLFQEAPVDRPGELHQRMLEVNDLIEPRAEQVMLAGLAPLLRPHRNPSVRSARAEGIMAANSRESTNRICKQTAPQVIQSSKIEYCKAPLQSCRSMAWQFFTADGSKRTRSEQADVDAVGSPLGRVWPRCRRLFRIQRLDGPFRSDVAVVGHR